MTVSKKIDTNGLYTPNWKAEEITQEQLHKLIHFNTEKYWHCWFDVKTKKLYDQYGFLIINNADKYLIEIGLIDENMNKILEFE